MSDLISRQAAIDAINTWDKFSVDERSRVVRWHEGLEPYVHLRDVVAAIGNLPSAQPEIIRCKDCGYWDTTWQNDFAPNYHYCSLVDGTRRGDFFCADAERRGEQDGNQREKNEDSYRELF